MNGRTLYYMLWIAGGIISLILTIYGCLASLMLAGDLSLALCLVAPLPSFIVGLIVGLRWKRCSAALLWLGFVALWWNRTHIHPNPEWNPVDSLGSLYLLPAAVVQLAIFLRPRETVLPVQSV
jgi:hypothetical protein